MLSEWRLLMLWLIYPSATYPKFFLFHLERLGSWPAPIQNYLRNLNLVDSWQDSLDGWPARRKATTYTGQHKQRINVERHPCLEWDSNPRFHCSSWRRYFVTKTPRPHYDRRYPKLLNKFHTNLFLVAIGTCNIEFRLYEAQVKIFINFSKMLAPIKIPWSTWFKK
jgi:hypothetical protein